MARIPLDFNTINDLGFPALPIGKYRVKVATVRQEPSKSSGELVLKVEFEIMDGPNGSSEFVGKKLFGNYSLQTKAAFRAKRFIAAAGIPAERMNEFDDEELVGRELFVSVSVEKYNGKDQNRVNSEDPVTDGAATAPVTPGTFAPPPAGFGAPAAGAWQNPPTWGNAPAAGAPMPPPAKPVT